MRRLTAGALLLALVAALASPAGEARPPRGPGAADDATPAGEALPHQHSRRRLFGPPPTHSLANDPDAFEAAFRFVPDATRLAFALHGPHDGSEALPPDLLEEVDRRAGALRVLLGPHPAETELWVNDLRLPAVSVPVDGAPLQQLPAAARGLQPATVGSSGPPPYNPVNASLLQAAQRCRRTLRGSKVDTTSKDGVIDVTALTAPWRMSQHRRLQFDGASDARAAAAGFWAAGQFGGCSSAVYVPPSTVATVVCYNPGVIPQTCASYCVRGFVPNVAGAAVSCSPTSRGSTCEPMIKKQGMGWYGVACSCQYCYPAHPVPEIGACRMACNPGRCSNNPCGQGCGSWAVTTTMQDCLAVAPAAVAFAGNGGYNTLDCRPCHYPPAIPGAVFVNLVGGTYPYQGDWVCDVGTYGPSGLSVTWTCNPSTVAGWSGPGLACFDCGSPSYAGADCFVSIDRVTGKTTASCSCGLGYYAAATPFKVECDRYRGWPADSPTLNPCRPCGAPTGLPWASCVAASYPGSADCTCVPPFVGPSITTLSCDQRTGYGNLSAPFCYNCASLSTIGGTCNTVIGTGGTFTTGSCTCNSGYYAPYGGVVSGICLPGGWTLSSSCLECGAAAFPGAICSTTGNSATCTCDIDSGFYGASFTATCSGSLMTSSNPSPWRAASSCTKCAVPPAGTFPGAVCAAVNASSAFCSCDAGFTGRGFTLACSQATGYPTSSATAAVPNSCVACGLPSVANGTCTPNVTGTATCRCQAGNFASIQPALPAVCDAFTGWRVDGRCIPCSSPEDAFPGATCELRTFGAFCSCTKPGYYGGDFSAACDTRGWSVSAGNTACTPCGLPPVPNAACVQGATPDEALCSCLPGYNANATSSLYAVCDRANGWGPVNGTCAGCVLPPLGPNLIRSVLARSSDGLYPYSVNYFCPPPYPLADVNSTCSFVSGDWSNGQPDCVPPSLTPSPSPSSTATPSTSVTGSATASVSATQVSPSVTPSVTPSNSMSPSLTPSTTVTPSVTGSSTPSTSITRTLLRSPSGTATSSRTPTPSGSVTSGLSRTLTPSTTPSPTASVTQPSTSGSPTRSRSASRSPSASVSGSPSGSASQSPSASSSASGSPSETATSSRTPSVTGSKTRSPSRTPSASASASNAATVSSSPSETPSPSASGSVSPSTTGSSSCTPSGSSTVTVTVSVGSSVSRTATGTPSRSGSSSGTPSGSATATHSGTVTATATGSRSVSGTATRSASGTGSSTATPSGSASGSGKPASKSPAAASRSPAGAAVSASPSAASSATAAAAGSLAPAPAATASADAGAATTSPSPSTSTSPSSSATASATVALPSLPPAPLLASNGLSLAALAHAPWPPFLAAAGAPRAQPVTAAATLAAAVAAGTAPAGVAGGAGVVSAAFPPTPIELVVGRVSPGAPTGGVQLACAVTPSTAVGGGAIPECSASAAPALLLPDGSATAANVTLTLPSMTSSSSAASVSLVLSLVASAATAWPAGAGLPAASRACEASLRCSFLPAATALPPALEVPLVSVLAALPVLSDLVQDRALPAVTYAAVSASGASAGTATLPPRTVARSARNGTWVALPASVTSLLAAVTALSDASVSTLAGAGGAALLPPSAGLNLTLLAPAGATFPAATTALLDVATAGGASLVLPLTPFDASARGVRVGYAGPLGPACAAADAAAAGNASVAMASSPCASAALVLITARATPAELAAAVRAPLLPPAAAVAALQQLAATGAGAALAYPPWPLLARGSSSGGSSLLDGGAASVAGLAYASLPSRLLAAAGGTTAATFSRRRASVDITVAAPLALEAGFAGRLVSPSASSSSAVTSVASSSSSSTLVTFVEPCSAASSSTTASLLDAVTAPDVCAVANDPRRGSCAWGSGTGCTRCPVAAAVCAAGEALSPLPGFWTPPAASSASGGPVVAGCAPPAEERCPGGNDASGRGALCGVGYQQGSYACGVCAPGYYPASERGGACTLCPASASLTDRLLPVAIFAGYVAAGALPLGLVIVLLHKRRGGSLARGLVRGALFLQSIVAAFQMLVQTKPSSPALPAATSALYKWLQVIELQGVVAHPACNPGDPTDAPFTFFLIDAGILALVIVLLVATRRVAPGTGRVAAGGSAATGTGGVAGGKKGIATAATTGGADGDAAFSGASPLLALPGAKGKATGGKTGPPQLLGGGADLAASSGGAPASATPRKDSACARWTPRLLRLALTAAFLLYARTVGEAYRSLHCSSTLLSAAAYVASPTADGTALAAAGVPLSVAAARDCLSAAAANGGLLAASCRSLAPFVGPALPVSLLVNTPSVVCSEGSHLRLSFTAWAMLFLKGGVLPLAVYAYARARRRRIAAASGLTLVFTAPDAAAGRCATTLRRAAGLPWGCAPGSGCAGCVGSRRRGALLRRNGAGSSSSQAHAASPNGGLPDYELEMALDGDSLATADPSVAFLAQAPLRSRRAWYWVVELGGLHLLSAAHVFLVPASDELAGRLHLGLGAGVLLALFYLVLVWVPHRDPAQRPVVLGTYALTAVALGLLYVSNAHLLALREAAAAAAAGSPAAAADATARAAAYADAVEALGYAVVVGVAALGVTILASFLLLFNMGLVEALPFPFAPTEAVVAVYGGGGGAAASSATVKPRAAAAVRRRGPAGGSGGDRNGSAGSRGGSAGASAGGASSGGAGLLSSSSLAGSDAGDGVLPTTHNPLGAAAATTAPPQASPQPLRPLSSVFKGRPVRSGSTTMLLDDDGSGAAVTPSVSTAALLASGRDGGPRAVLQPMPSRSGLLASASVRGGGDDGVPAFSMSVNGKGRASVRLLRHAPGAGAGRPGGLTSRRTAAAAAAPGGAWAVESKAAAGEGGPVGSRPVSSSRSRVPAAGAAASSGGGGSGEPRPHSWRASLRRSVERGIAGLLKAQPGQGQ